MDNKENINGLDNELFSKLDIGDSRTEEKPEDMAIRVQPGNGGAYNEINGQIPLYDLSTNPSGILPKLLDNGEMGKFLSDLRESITIDIGTRYKTADSSVRKKLGPVDIRVITVATTADASGNRIPNPTLIITLGVEADGDYYIVYVPFLFTHMGIGTETVGSIYDKVIAPNNHFQQTRPVIQTFDKVIDRTFLDIITGYIRESYQDVLHGKEYKSCYLESVIMSDTIGEGSIQEISTRVTDIALNKLVTYVAIILKRAASETNLANNFVGTGRDIETNLSIKTHNPHDNHTELNQVGSPTRADFEVTLYSNNKNQLQQNYSPNKVENSFPVALAKGYIDVLPEQIIVPETGKHEFKWRPNIILTETSNLYPTLANKLLSILIGYTMISKQYILYSHLRNVVTPNGKESPNSFGILNYYSDVMEDRQKRDKNNNPIEPEFINLSSSKLTDEAKSQILNKLLILSGSVVSLDIGSYTDQSYVDQAFISASEPDNKANIGAKRAAGMEIINAARQLTNGKFPANFPLENIFTDSVSIPMGYIIQNDSKLIDIRLVDFPFVIQGSNKNQEVINEYYNSFFSNSQPNRDPFLSKINVYKELGLRDAKITGRGTRVTFSADFLRELYTAAREVGFKPSVDIPGIQFQDQVLFGNNSFHKAFTDNINPYEYKLGSNNNSGYYFAGNWNTVNRFNR